MRLGAAHSGDVQPGAEAGERVLLDFKDTKTGAGLSANLLQKEVFCREVWSMAATQEVATFEQADSHKTKMRQTTQARK